MATKNPDQRVGIFIDVQNLYYSARALYGTKVNFGEIVRTATAGRKLVRAIAYAVKAEMPEEQSFFDALEKAGLEVKTKDLQTFSSGQKKADWDVGIAVDILNMAPKLDAVVLCSGDGDFQILMHQAKTEGCRAEVISFGKSTSAKLIEEADDFNDMDIDAERYLLGYKNPQKPSVAKTTVARPVNIEDQVINAINKDTPQPAKKRFFKSLK
jgi:uncharacterized LabA/DUF88 family protein